MKKLSVDLAGREYDIYIGSGILQSAGEIFRGIFSFDRATVITDKNVFPLYGEKLKESLFKSGISVEFIVFEPGEQSKNIHTLNEIYEELLSKGHKRNSPIIALGGGVVGDIAGFAAATYMRGVPFMQIPTTLLAQIDSSVGGKVAIDLKNAKNSVGAFYHPKAVIADLDTLCTLPKREIASGSAELIKYGILKGGGFFKSLESKNINSEVVLDCLNIKKDFVISDEFDFGRRMLLNLGHTFGHAIEKLGGYKEYTHGEGVSIGILMAAKVGESLGITKKGIIKQIEDILLKWELPIKCDYKPHEIAAVMKGDKKNTDELITLILVEYIGSCITYKIKSDELIKIMEVI